MSKAQDDFDYKNSLVYMNSTAALMETLFKNMKNEDFVYPTKKQVSADEGAIIRSEELMKRQKAATETFPFVIRDPYLESMLAKMSDEDFTYETKKPVDPNYGRVVRALELMELSGCSTSTEPEMKVEVERREKKKPSIQKENIVAPVEQHPAIGSRNSDVGTGNCNGATPENKRFGAPNKKHGNKNRVKYDIPTWKNDRRSFGNDNGYQTRRQSNDNYRPANNNGSHFYENRTFSPKNFNSFGGSNGAPRHHKNNGYGHGSSRGRGNQYGGPQRNLENSSYWNSNQTTNGTQEFWGQPGADSQILWK